MLADTLRSILGASAGQPPTVPISLVSPGLSAVRSATGSRIFPNWVPRPPPECPPYQHWNKNYWIEHEGDPEFAETAALRRFDDHDWDARWVTWSGGRPTFRTAPRVGAKELPTGLGAHWFDLIWSEKRSREADLVRAGYDPKLLGGGCWDVLAWNAEGVAFVETKQVGQGWQDTIRLSQRLWLEAALACGLETTSFLILEWKLSC